MLVEFIKKIKRRIIKKRINTVNIPVLYGELLNNRIALITGGSRGIGFEIAKAVLRNGGSVVITSQNSEDVKKCVVELTKEYNSNKVYGIKLEISDINSHNNVFKNALELLKGRKIDILINNAGVSRGENFGTTGEKDFDKCISVNLKGLYFFSQIVTNYMKDNEIKGNILNLASSSSLRPCKSPYAISKWGIRGLTIGMAQMLTSFGITVNALAPGPTYTKMLVNEITDNQLESINNPVGRYISPVEIANMAVILVSDLGKMIIGDTVYMTGGSAMLVHDDNYCEF